MLAQHRQNLGIKVDLIVESVNADGKDYKSLSLYSALQTYCLAHIWFTQAPRETFVV